jgi:hypothetical protein
MGACSQQNETKKKKEHLILFIVLILPITGINEVNPFLSAAQIREAISASFFVLHSWELVSKRME